VPERILCVDDEPSVLAGYRRTLYRSFETVLVTSPLEALSMLETQPDFPVIISDFRMPEMDGAQFLARAAEVSPASARILLTGHADLEVAIEAVNRGQIFRFLRKPCPTDVLMLALNDGLRMYRLEQQERFLLDETLRGSLRMLAETLSLANPVAFGVGSRIEPMVRHMAEQLGLAEPWQYSVAATVSQVGCVTLPQALVERAQGDTELSAEERAQFEAHAEAGARLVANVPRLEAVADMVRRQESAPILAGQAARMAESDPGLVGGQLLRVAIAMDRHLRRGEEPEAALAALAREPGTYSAELLGTLRGLQFERAHSAVRAIRAEELVEGMLLEEDVRTRAGVLLVARGHEVTGGIREHLRRASQRGELREPFQVRLQLTRPVHRGHPTTRR
jgi:response regulator RpfG family c-di-GMP phosphodiesterase